MTKGTRRNVSCTFALLDYWWQGGAIIYRTALIVVRASVSDSLITSAHDSHTLDNAPLLLFLLLLLLACLLPYLYVSVFIFY